MIEIFYTVFELQSMINAQVAKEIEVLQFILMLMGFTCYKVYINLSIAQCVNV